MRIKVLKLVFVKVVKKTDEFCDADHTLTRLHEVPGVVYPGRISKHLPGMPSFTLKFLLELLVSARIRPAHNAFLLNAHAWGLNQERDKVKSGLDMSIGSEAEPVVMLLLRKYYDRLTSPLHFLHRLQTNVEIIKTAVIYH